MQHSHNLTRDDAQLLAYAAGAFVLLQVLLKLFMHWVVEIKATTAFFRATSLTAATHILVRTTRGAQQAMCVYVLTTLHWSITGGAH